MQPLLLKKLLFFFTGSLLTTAAWAVPTPLETLHVADSFFAKARYEEAGKLYENVLAEPIQPSARVYLKMAFIRERQHNDPETMLYLNRYYERNPDAQVLRKMAVIAQKHNWEGYELNDFNLLIFLYKKYGIYLISTLLLLAGYIFVVLWNKTAKQQYILNRHKLIFLGYLIGIGVLVNLPDNYAVAIVHSPRVLLRADPSAAAPITQTVRLGNRFSVLGSDDVWLRVVWNKQLSYVRKTDVWLVD